VVEEVEAELEDHQPVVEEVEEDGKYFIILLFYYFIILLFYYFIIFNHIYD